MWRHLLEIYEKSCLNEGEPECLFAETLIFNEGWLLRSVLKKWKTHPSKSRFEFLPFPLETSVYSEGQLRTPFKARPGGGAKAESHTRVDGVAGQFSIADGTKSAIELASDCEYIAVFEAKLFSPIGKGVKNAPDYDQVSRTAACLIHAVLEPEPALGCAAHIAVLYPEDNSDINPDTYSKVHIKDQIANRLEEYKQAGDSTADIQRFEAGWEEMLDRLWIHFETWEEVLDDIGDAELKRFYELCKEYNR